MPHGADLGKYCDTHALSRGLPAEVYSRVSTRFLLAASGSFSQYWHTGFPPIARSLLSPAHRYSSLHSFCVIQLISGMNKRENKNALHPGRTKSVHSLVIPPSFIDASQH